MVDNEEIVLETGARMLERLGYRVLSAGSGMEAINVFKNRRKEIDMVILDVIMPKMDGGKTYEKIKEINPKVKFLLVSGSSIDGKATELLNRGCDGFIQKPFDLFILSVKLKKM